MFQMLKKVFRGQSAAKATRSSARASGRRRSFLPGIETFGGSLDSGRSRPVRPEVEQLEERRLMSSSGVISAVTDNRGQTTLFEVAANAQVYELSPGVSGRHRFPFVNSDPVGFRQVSAGLDASGRAVCYALHNGDNHVWEMDNYHTTGFTSQGSDLGYTATQISATRNNECFTIHPNYPSDQVGIY